MLEDTETGRLLTEENEEDLSRAVSPSPELRIKEIQDGISANTWGSEDKMTFGASDVGSPKKDVELGPKLFNKPSKAYVDEAELERLRIEEQNESAFTSGERVDTEKEQQKLAKLAATAAKLKIE